LGFATLDKIKEPKPPAVTTRRFPPPWSAEEYNDACFVVTDSAGQKLAYVYFEDEPGRRSAAKLLSKDLGATYRGKCGEVAGAVAAVRFLTRHYLRHRGIRKPRVVCLISNQRSDGDDGGNKGRK
jgi:hypothetical protein